MSERSHTPIARLTISSRRPERHLLRFAVLALIALLAAVGPTLAQSVEDLYVRAYDMIQEGDTLQAGGKTGPALAKYRSAYETLQELKQENPVWNSAVVGFRLKYLTDKIGALTKALYAPATAAAPAAAGETRSGAAVAGTTGAAQIKLLEAGAEPRKVLRYQPKVGEKQSFTLTTVMAMNLMAADGQGQGQLMKMPTSKMGLELTTTSVSPEGDISFEVVIGDGEVTADSETIPQLADAMKGALATIKGRTGKGTMSSSGLIKAAEFAAPANAEPQVRQTLDQLKGIILGLGTALPGEAVGAGAKWEAKVPVVAQGMTLEQTTSYELVSIEGEQVSVKEAIAQRATNQKIDNPAMPGVKVEVPKMEGKGKATTVVDLGKVAPVESTGEIQSEFMMNLDVGGTKQSMKMKLDLKIQVQTQ